MAVKAGLAEEQAQRVAKLGCSGGNGVADGFQAFGAVRRVLRHAGRGAVFAVKPPHRGGPFAGRDARFGTGDGGWHDVCAGLGRLPQCGEGFADSVRVALGAPLGQAGALVGLGAWVGLHDQAVAGGQRRGFGGGEAVHTDDDSLAGFDAGQAVGVRIDQTGFHVPDGRDRPAHRVDVGQFLQGPGLQRGHLSVDGRVAVEEVVIFQKVGLIGQDLLHPKRPLLIEGSWQAQSLVPGGKLDGAGAGVL